MFKNVEVPREPIRLIIYFIVFGVKCFDGSITMGLGESAVCQICLRQSFFPRTLKSNRI